MTVPSKSYARQYQEIWDEVRAAIDRVLLGEAPILGGSVACFEEKLARFVGTDFVVGVGSGTDALILLLRELGLPPGAEVITCAHTFSGVVSALLQAGVTPVLVDPDPRTGLLDVPAAEEAITDRTRAVLAVHLYGQPVDLDAVISLCERRGLLLLEDTAQAQGALWRGRPVGSFGKASITSFHPSKNLGAFGDGGAILTCDADLAAALRIARNLGKDGKYEFARISANSKLDSLQAAILDVKLGHLEAWVERRRHLASIYLEGLAELDGLTLPQEDPRGRHAYHLFVVRVGEGRRDGLREFLSGRGIKTGLHYPIAAHRQPALAPYCEGAKLPVAEYFAEQVVTLPLSHEHEEEEIRSVVDAVRDFFG